MKVIKNELIAYCDVDDTIVKWSEPTIPGTDKIEFDFADKKVYLTPHQYHIDLIKMYRKRGYHVTIWSANGWEWAKQVVEKLELQNYVDVVQSKSLKWVDDSTDAHAVLGARVFCDDLTAPAPLPYIDVQGAYETVGPFFK